MSPDRPIIFSAPMVRSLLDGRKIQTRRLLKPQPAPDGKFQQIENAKRALKWVAGDRLWVRETWQTGMTTGGPKIAYRATRDFCEIDAWDGPDQGRGASFNYDRCPGARWHDWLEDVLAKNGPWRTPIHMPRWASRLTLIVESVKVERLQDISEADARAEGVHRPHGFFDDDGTSFTDGFGNLWEEIHGVGAWDENPYVAAIAFRVVNANIDNSREQP